MSMNIMKMSEEVILVGQQIIVDMKCILYELYMSTPDLFSFRLLIQEVVVLTLWLVKSFYYMLFS